MNNLYEIFEQMQEVYKDFENAKKELKKGEKFIEFREDLQEVLCDILKGKKEHYLRKDIAELYEKKLGIKCKEITRNYFPSIFSFGDYMFKLNKTNLNKIEKYLQSGDVNYE